MHEFLTRQALDFFRYMHIEPFKAHMSSLGAHIPPPQAGIRLKFHNESAPVSLATSTPSRKPQSVSMTSSPDRVVSSLLSYLSRCRVHISRNFAVQSFNK